MFHKTQQSRSISRFKRTEDKTRVVCSVRIGAKLFFALFQLVEPIRLEQIIYNHCPFPSERVSYQAIYLYSYLQSIPYIIAVADSRLQLLCEDINPAFSPFERVSVIYGTYRGHDKNENNACPSARIFCFCSVLISNWVGQPRASYHFN